MTSIAIQGDVGSATESAARYFRRTENLRDASFQFLITAERVLEALESGRVELAVIAAESPVGTPLQETVEALKGRPALLVHAEADLEVNHVVLGKSKLSDEQYERVISHPVALRKHEDFLHRRFPNALVEPLEL